MKAFVVHSPGFTIRIEIFVPNEGRGDVALLPLQIKRRTIINGRFCNRIYWPQKKSIKKAPESGAFNKVVPPGLEPGTT